MNKKKGLVAYWFVLPKEKAYPLGFGVTGFNEIDAIQILRSEGYEIEGAKIKEIKSTDELDQNHVLPNMGPPNMRGIWFPCMNLGYSNDNLKS